MPESFNGGLVVILQSSKGFVALNPADIKQFYFIESIFQWFITGKLIYHDRDGFIESVCISGNEQIVILYGVDSNRDMLFDIFKIKKLSPADSNVEKGLFFEIVFVDSTFRMLANEVYSRSWSESSKISTIVEDLLNFAYIKKTPPDDKYLKINRWEDSINTMDNFVMPFWSPMKTIRWLNQKAKGNITNTSGYLCYNSTSDQIGGICSNWLTIEGLFGNYKNTTIKTYVDPKPYYFSVSDSLLYRNKILEWVRSGPDNHDIRHLGGGHRMSFDFDGKRFNDRSFIYSEVAPKFSMMGKYTLFPNIDNYSSNYKVESVDTDEELDNNFLSGWINRYSRQNSVIITTYGHEERYVGMQIDVRWESAGTSIPYNINLTGKYLVGSIIHVFGAHGSFGYLQKMKLLKNAYHDSENTDLIKAEKTNKEFEAGDLSVIL